MEAFLVSTLIVGLSEIGDRTQLLALVLAARFRKPWPIIAAIFCATIANHTLAGIVGQWVGLALNPVFLRYVLTLSFIAMGFWALKADALEDKPPAAPGRSAFWTTLVAFFMAEIGDKTQIATAALAIKYPNLILVICGTTLGMMLANIPAVIVGHVGSGKIPLRLFHYAAAALFFVQAWLTFKGLVLLPGGL